MKYQIIATSIIIFKAKIHLRTTYKNAGQGCVLRPAAHSTGPDTKTTAPSYFVLVSDVNCLAKTKVIGQK